MAAVTCLAAKQNSAGQIIFCRESAAFKFAAVRQQAGEPGFGGWCICAEFNQAADLKAAHWQNQTGRSLCGCVGFNPISETARGAFALVKTQCQRRDGGGFSGEELYAHGKRVRILPQGPAHAAQGEGCIRRDAGSDQGADGNACALLDWARNTQAAGGPV